MVKELKAGDVVLVRARVKSVETTTDRPDLRLETLEPSHDGSGPTGFWASSAQVELAPPEPAVDEPPAAVEPPAAIEPPPAAEVKE